MNRLLSSPIGWLVALGLVCLFFSPLVPAQSASKVKTLPGDTSTCGGGALNSEGLKYFRGQGVPKDDWRALRLFEKAATDCNDADAMANLGYMYQTGAAVPVDPYLAKPLYEKSVELGSVEGLTRLGQWYAGGFPLPDYTRARMLLEKAAAQGSRTAEFSLGNAYLFGQWGVPRDPSRAIEYFRNVVETPPAEWDDPDLAMNAASWIAGIYEGAAGFPKDEKRAFEWRQKAAMLGDPRAMKPLSEMYRDGRGVEKDPQQAQIWADRAAALESKPAVTPNNEQCKGEQLDSSMHLYNQHNHLFTVTVETRNISTQPCRLDYVTARFMGAGTATNHILQKVHVEVCQNCDQWGRAQRPRTIILSPNQVLHADISWQGVPDTSGTPCVAIGSMGVGFTLNAGAFNFYPGSPGIPICSTVNAGPLMPGPDPRAAKEMAHVAALKVSAPKSTYFPREHMLLVVNATAGDSFPGPGSPCPFFQQRIRYPNGVIQYVPMAGGDARCKIIPAYRSGSAGSSALEVTLLANVYRELGDYQIQFLQYDPPGSQNSWRLLAESDRFTYRLDDSYKVERTWGPPVKGLAANIALDKTNYSLGEDVPLHLALKNISVPDRSFHVQLCTDAVITVRDQSGHKIEPTGDQEFCSQNGTYNPYFPPGDLIPTEHSLKLMGLLPSKPGTYTIESTWTMYPKPPGAKGMYSRNKDVGDSYAVVSSAPVTFLITGPPQN